MLTLTAQRGDSVSSPIVSADSRTRLRKGVEELSSKRLRLGVLEDDGTGRVDGGIVGGEARTRESARLLNVSSSFWQLMRSFSNLSRSLIHWEQSRAAKST